MLEVESALEASNGSGPERKGSYLQMRLHEIETH